MRDVVVAVQVALCVVLGRLARLLAIGALAGLILVVAAGHVFVASIVYEASAADPLVLGTVAALFVVIGIAASWAPMRRALMVEPMNVLRPD